jgi:hypothetical protein
MTTATKEAPQVAVGPINKSYLDLEVPIRDVHTWQGSLAT